MQTCSAVGNRMITQAAAATLKLNWPTSYQTTACLLSSRFYLPILDTATRFSAFHGNPLWKSVGIFGSKLKWKSRRGSLALFAGWPADEIWWLADKKRWGMGTCIELSFRRVPKTTKKQNNLKRIGV